MTANEKAEQLIKTHLTAIAEESMDSDCMMLHSAIGCAKATVEEILNTLDLELCDLYGNFYVNPKIKEWNDVKNVLILKQK